MTFFDRFSRMKTSILTATVITAILFPSSAVGQIAFDDRLPNGKKSDGCTLIPDGPYRPCCVEHDRAYFAGGSSKERRKADKRLYQCVRKTPGVANKLVAAFMWIGVRIGGVSFLPTPFRWGFGKRAENRAGTLSQSPEPSPAPQLP